MKIKTFLIAAAAVAAMCGAAFAQNNDVPGCKLVSEGNGTKVWQCAPTPSTTPTPTSDKN